MFLEKPSYPVSFSLGEAEDKVSQLLDKKNWSNYSFSTTTLIYVPYLFFSYDIYEESKGKTKSLGSGYNALNVFSGDLDKEVGELQKNEEAEKSFELSDHYSSRVLPLKLSEDEAKNLVLLKIASENKASASNVVLHSVETSFVPFWLVKFFIGEEELALRMNATTGKVLEAHSIPMREKGVSELTSEALDELSDPKQWLAYSKELVSSISGAASAVSGSSASRNDLFSEDNAVLFLGILAIIVIIWFAYL